MGYEIPPEHLGELYRVLLTERPNPPPTAGAAIIRKIVRDGWASESQVDDLMGLTDRRLDGLRSKVKLRDVAQALGLSMRSACPRPNSRTSSVFFQQAWHAVDLASLLIALEMLGFAVDPAPLVDAVYSEIPKKGYISSAALDVLWYAKMRRKGRITFQRQDGGAPIGARKQHVLADGYKLTALLDSDGAPISLTVSGPGYRTQPKPVEVKCPQCAQNWWRGDQESSAMHRRIHRERMAVLQPRPNERVKTLIADGESSLHVDWQSPKWLHQEMYVRASAFRREMGYDFMQWDCPERDRDAHGFLFLNKTGAILGACAFRLRNYGIGSDRWGLQWIWIAPTYRRRGILRSHWPALRGQFGDFEIEPPVSDAMQSFTRKVGDGHLLDDNTPAGSPTR